MSTKDDLPPAISSRKGLVAAVAGIATLAVVTLSAEPWREEPAVPNFMPSPQIIAPQMHLPHARLMPSAPGFFSGPDGLNSQCPPSAWC